jgi:hypothetical protein
LKSIAAASAVISASVFPLSGTTRRSYSLLDQRAGRAERRPVQGDTG